MSSKISALTDAGTLDGTEIVPVVRGSGSPLTYANRRSTSSEIARIGTSPGGRLTLVSGTPVMQSDQTAKTTVYYCSYVHDRVPVGGLLLPIPSNEVSMGLDAGVPHVASGSVYDIFAINNGGALVTAIGPAWSSTTSRGTGAGTTELAFSGGVLTNANSLTHAWGGASGTTDYGAIAANAATYLGSIYATANGQTGMSYQPAAASGGTANILGLYNGYNRVPAQAMCRDSTSSWTTTNTSFEALNVGVSSGTKNRITWLDGLGQSPASASAFITARTANPADHTKLGVVFDATTGTPATYAQTQVTNNVELSPTPVFLTAIGLHFAQAMQAVSSGTGTYSAASVVEAMTLIVPM